MGGKERQNWKRADERKQDNGAKTDQKGNLYRERKRRRVRSVRHTVFSLLSFRQTSWTFFMPMFADPHETHTWYYLPRFSSSLRQQPLCTSSESGPNPILLAPLPRSLISSPYLVLLSVGIYQRYYVFGVCFKNLWTTLGVLVLTSSLVFYSPDALKRWGRLNEALVSPKY